MSKSLGVMQWFKIAMGDELGDDEKKSSWNEITWILQILRMYYVLQSSTMSYLENRKKNNVKVYIY